MLPTDRSSTQGTATVVALAAIGPKDELEAMMAAFRQEQVRMHFSILTRFAMSKGPCEMTVHVRNEGNLR
jgi:hypothetical protein